MDKVSTLAPFEKRLGNALKTEQEQDILLEVDEKTLAIFCHPSLLFISFTLLFLLNFLLLQEVIQK